MQAGLPFMFVANLRNRPPLPKVLELLSRTPTYGATQMVKTLRIMCEEV